MALDIGIDVGSSLIRAQGETWLRMENAAPSWFLHPLFEKLRAETGQYIDLYASATFADEQLAALKKMLAEAQPDCWEVQVGAGPPGFARATGSGDGPPDRSMGTSCGPGGGVGTPGRLLWGLRIAALALRPNCDRSHRLGV